MATDAFRDLVGWFPRSGKAAERLWMQHQGIVADAEKLAQMQQKIDVIFLQVGDPFLARVKDLNVEVLKPSWISESLEEGKLSLVAPFRLTDPPEPFPTRSLPPLPRSHSAHADAAEHAIVNEQTLRNIETCVEITTSKPTTQQSKATETFSPISQSGYSTGLFAYPTAHTNIKVESPPHVLRTADARTFDKPVLQISSEDAEIKAHNATPNVAMPYKVSFEEKMEGIRRSIEEISAKQGIKPPVKRERHSPVMPFKSPPKPSSSPKIKNLRGDWRAQAALGRSISDDSKSYIRSYSTRRGRSMSFKQEEDEGVLAVPSTPLSMRRQGPYFRSTTNKTNVYHSNKAQRVLLSPIKIKNTISRQIE